MIVIVEDLDDPLCCFDWFWENHTYFEASIGMKPLEPKLKLS